MVVVMHRGIIISHLVLLVRTLASRCLELWIILLQLLLSDGLHKLVHLGNLLVCQAVSRAMVRGGKWNANRSSCQSLPCPSSLLSTSRPRSVVRILAIL